MDKFSVTEVPQEIEQIQSFKVQTQHYEQLQSTKVPTQHYEKLQQSIQTNELHMQQLDKLQQQELVKLDKSLTPKRKKVVLNFVQKFEILDKLKAGMKVADIAAEYNIGMTTVCDIRKHGDEKLLKYRKDNIFNMNRKTSKSSEFPLLDKALKLWVYQERSKRYCLTDSIFSTKALEFFQILYPNSKKIFKASHGYVDKFCKRFEISLRNEPSKMYADLSKLDAFILDFQELNYTQEQIYNADEFGLNYEELPTLSQSKEKISLMVCCNASGKHKLPMVLVNKNPIDHSKLPVYFKHSTRGWMTQEIFETWFHKEFVPKVQAYLSSINQEEKAILLLDNCPAHTMKLESSDGKVKCLFLPLESSSILMPMNQGPIAYLKRKYRTNFLRAACMDEAFLSCQTIKNAFYSLANLWEEMPENLLKFCWQKMRINLNVTCNLEPIDMVELRANFQSLGVTLDDMEINNWLDVDFDDPGYGLLTDEEIIEEIKSEAAEQTPITLSDITDSVIDSQEKKAISSAEAYARCTDLMHWLETQSGAKPEDLIFVQRVKELASGPSTEECANITTQNIENSIGITPEPLTSIPVNNLQLTSVPVANGDVAVYSQCDLNKSNGNNLIREAETLTLCFLSESGSLTDANGKVIVQGSSHLALI